MTISIVIGGHLILQFALLPGLRIFRAVEEEEEEIDEQPERQRIGFVDEQ